MEINSFFFTNSIMESYISQVNTVLGNKIILNQDGFIRYLLGDDDYAVNKQKYLRFMYQSLISSDICQGAIGKAYTDSIISDVFNPNFSIKCEYDIFFILNRSENASAPETWEQKFADIIGFCIVKRKGCQKMAKAYVLNLVCSKSGANVGNICVCLYLYAILMHPQDTRETIIPIKIEPTMTEVPVLHIGLLELSGGYKNIPGLCLYSKFGFVVDKQLSGMDSNCFRDTNNIGMINRYIEDSSVTIEERKQKIINIVNKVDPGYEKHVICNTPNKEAQKKLVEIYSNIKINTEQMTSLSKQAKFAINKETDGTLKPEFKKRMDDKIQEINELEDMIKQIMEMKIKGGKSKTFRRRKNLKKRKTQKKKLNTKERKSRRHY
jgi:hypothetical protein